MRLQAVPSAPGSFRDPETGHIYKIELRKGCLPASVLPIIVELLETRILVNKAREKMAKIPHLPKMNAGFFTDTEEGLERIDERIEKIIEEIQKELT